MHKMWDTFAAANPLFTSPRLSKCGPEVLTEINRRKRISLNDFKIRYKHRHWLKLYIKIRNIETNKYLPEQQIKLVTKNALDLHNYKGKIEALDYVQKVFAGFVGQIGETKVLTEQEIVATIQEAQTQVMTPTVSPTVSPTVINEFAEVIPEY